MFSITQPSRPRVTPAHTISPPMNQQPSRQTSSISSNVASIPTPRYEPPRAPQSRPRSQIEAMPPLTHRPALAVFDPSRRHPVFFTDKLHMAPAGMGTGESSWMSPVSKGYVFNDGERRKVEGVVKL